MRRFLTRYTEPVVKTQDLIAVLPGQVPQSANLQAWWRADSGLFQDSALTTPATADGNPVGGWIDRQKSVAIIQATSTRRGTLRLSGINGMPAVQFLAVNGQNLQAAALGPIFSGAKIPKTFISVVKLTSLPGGSPWTVSGVSNTGGIQQQDIMRAFGGWSHRQVDDASASVVQSGGTLDTNAHVYSGIFDGVNQFIRLDGALLTVGAGLTSTMTFNQGGLAGRGGNNNIMDGYIAESIMYNIALTNASIAAWETYLSRRYGIPLV